MDATIIEAPSSTKNKAGKRDSEIHQTMKRNQWLPTEGSYWCRRSHRLTHSFTTTNEHDLNQAEHQLRGDEGFIFTDTGYPGAEKREELKGMRYSFGDIVANLKYPLN